MNRKEESYCYDSSLGRNTGYYGLLAVHVVEVGVSAVHPAAAGDLLEPGLLDADDISAGSDEGSPQEVGSQVIADRATARITEPRGSLVATIAGVVAMRDVLPKRSCIGEATAGAGITVLESHLRSHGAT